MLYVWLVLFILSVGGLWCLNVLGLPGNWGAVLLIGLWMWLGPRDAPWQIGWPVLVAVIVLAAFGEVVEFAAGLIGAKQLGGSQRGAWLALVGSIAGGIAGAIVGLPIPVPIVGSVVGSLLLACFGALIGAFVGEKWAGKTTSESLQVGGVAFFGRFVGTAVKVVVGSVISLISILGLFL